MNFLRGIVNRVKSLFGGGRAELASLVVLTDQQIDVSIEDLQGHLGILFPEHFPPGIEAHEDDDDVSFVVDMLDNPMGGKSLFVKSLVPGKSGLFMVHTSPNNRFDKPIPTEPSTDGVEAVLERHRSWFSADLLSEIGSKTEGRAFMSVLAGALAPHDAMALYDPHMKQLIMFDDEIRVSLLMGEDLFTDGAASGTGV